MQKRGRQEEERKEERRLDGCAGRIREKDAPGIAGQTDRVRGVSEEKIVKRLREAKTISPGATGGKVLRFFGDLARHEWVLGGSEDGAGKEEEWRALHGLTHSVWGGGHRGHSTLASQGMGILLGGVELNSGEWGEEERLARQGGKEMIPNNQSFESKIGSTWDMKKGLNETGESKGHHGGEDSADVKGGDYKKGGEEGGDRERGEMHRGGHFGTGRTEKNELTDDCGKGRSYFSKRKRALRRIARVTWCKQGGGLD